MEGVRSATSGALREVKRTAATELASVSHLHFWCEETHGEYKEKPRALKFVSKQISTSILSRQAQDSERKELSGHVSDPGQPILSARTMLWFWREYLEHYEDSSNPRAAPLVADLEKVVAYF